MSIEVTRAAEAGRTVWWINAVLAQVCAPDDATAAVLGRFAGLSPSGPVTGAAVIGALRSRGVPRLVLAVVEPGDPVGLPGPGEVTRAAVAAGLAAPAADGRLTLVPEPGRPPLDWTAWPSTPGMDPVAALGSLGQAHSLMREGMLELTRTMPGMEPDDAAVAQLRDYRRWSAPAPAPGVEPRAAQVADAALRVWWLTAIAADLAQRRGHAAPAAVRRLRPLARRAVSAAFSAAPRAGHGDGGVDRYR